MSILLSTTVTSTTSLTIQDLGSITIPPHPSTLELEDDFGLDVFQVLNSSEIADGISAGKLTLNIDGNLVTDPSSYLKIVQDLSSPSAFSVLSTSGLNSYLPNQATETVAGKIELATQSEVDSGTDDLRAITPLKLKDTTLVVHTSGNETISGTKTFSAENIQINSANSPNNLRIGWEPNTGGFDSYGISAPNETQISILPQSTTVKLLLGSTAFFSSPSSGYLNVGGNGNLYLNTQNALEGGEENFGEVVVGLGGLRVSNLDVNSFVRTDSTGKLVSATGAISRHVFLADTFDSPNNSDWAVNSFASLASDSLHNALRVRQFDDTTEEGVGFLFEIPPNTTSIKLSFRWRVQTAPGTPKSVILQLYSRPISSFSWSSVTLTPFTTTTDTQFQISSQTFPLTTLGLTAGSAAQFEVVRKNTDTLTGDWNLLSLVAEFLYGY